MENRIDAYHRRIAEANVVDALRRNREALKRLSGRRIHDIRASMLNLGIYIQECKENHGEKITFKELREKDQELHRKAIEALMKVEEMIKDISSSEN